MVTGYDYLNIAFYIAFIAGVGIYFARRSKNTSDYFRGGGMLPWWVTGASAWMASFSAWTFTGAAGKMYASGPYAFGLYYSGLAGMMVLLFFSCQRFRRMQVVTPLEAVRLRYGPGAQQFFTWMRLPFMLLFGGVGLNAIGVFMAAVFDVPLPTVIVGLGLLVTFLSLLGGSFGVAASDFVQMFLVVTVTVTVSVLALSLPGIDGPLGMWRQAPPQHHDWSTLARPSLIVLWVLALTVTKILEQNSMDASAKFLMTRDDRHARLMLIIPIIGALLGPLLWIVPPTVAAIRHPDMAALFPALQFPQEAAFLVTAAEVLPKGMLGLLICGIFAATLTTMDAGLNQGAGVFVRNFYLPILRPQADERRLLIVSKIATGCFGALMVVIGLMFNRFREAELFDLVNQVAVSLAVPISIPLFFGLFMRRTPAWSTWSTVLIGLATSFTIKFLVPAERLVAWVPGLQGPYLPEERTQVVLIATVGAVCVNCIAWYCMTTLFYARSPAAYRANVDAFFERLRTPVISTPGEGVRENQGIGAAIGWLCVVYGSFVALFALIPNPPRGRVCFLGCGGVMIAMGAFLARRYRVSKPLPPVGDALQDQHE